MLFFCSLVSPDVSSLDGVAQLGNEGLVISMQLLHSAATSAGGAPLK